MPAKRTPTPATPRTTLRQSLAFKIAVAIPVAIVGWTFLQTESREGISPRSRRLIAAVESNDLMAAATLLESGADPDAAAADGTISLAQAVRNDSLGMLRLLLDNGADVNLADSDGVSPLELAVKLDKPLIVRSLLEAGASVDAEESNGQKPLITFAKSDAVRELISRRLASAESPTRR
jgi:hypothetical protein